MHQVFQVMAGAAAAALAMEETLEATFGPQREWQECVTGFIGSNAESLIPADCTPDDIMEAFELWSFPPEAYPANPGDVTYTLKMPSHAEDAEDAQDADIHVFLLRQAFRTKPKHQKHGHWSFWCSPQFEEVGAVRNPMCIGKGNTDSGYNHSSAYLAWAEAQILAGWQDDVFAVEWHKNFNLQKLPHQTFPPSLCEYILMMWPDNIGLCLHCASDLQADPKHESMVQLEKDMNAVQLDCMHLAVAQAQVPDVDPDDDWNVVQFHHGMEVVEECNDG